MGRSDTLMASTLYISPIRRTTLARGRLQRALAIGVCLALLPNVVRSQNVIKPSAGTTTTYERLPAPKPTARQLPDGRIEVS